MRFIERPPRLYRWLFRRALWRMPARPRKTVYITFDDGPIPGVTPWVLELLDSFGIKATFFMVGENIRRNPAVFELVRSRGHVIGNHSLSHIQGLKSSCEDYLVNVADGAALTGSNLFRPPHGLMKPAQLRHIRRRYRLVMYDLVTRDYSRKLSPEQVFDNVRRFARDGSIIVFHDSLKAWPNLRTALPRALGWLRDQGYEFGVIQ